MALIIKDRVKEITTTTGTGAVSLGGSSATFDAFQSVMSNGDTTFYAIVHTASGTDEWEVGLGTWNTGNTLTRTTVYAGSNGTSAVNFSSGNKDIFMTYPANKAAVAGEDVTFADVTVSGDLTVSGTTTTLNTETIALADNTIVLNSNATGSASEDAGIEIERGDDTNKTLLWDETNDKWTIGTESFSSGNIDVTGNITVSGTVDGVDVATRDGVLTSTTTTANAALPKAGGQMTGNITMSGSQTVDGRDLSVDGAKLDGIESGATADQTASEILTAIKTVDGASSGLDADLLDGQQGSYYINTSTTFSGDVSGTYNAIVVANDSHTHDGRYYTETEADSRFVNATGDTMSGTLVVNNVDAGNPSASSNNIRVSGYGILGNRGTFYVTNPGTVEIGVGSTHNSDPAMTFTSTQNTSYHTLYENSNRVFTDGYHPNADKWTTARTLSLSGDASGSVSWDGSANATLSVTVANDSHTHNKLIAVDDRDMKPNTSGIASGNKAIRAFFSTKEGMTGSSGSNYHDVLVLDTYSDSSGGGPNAITFDKGNSAGNPEAYLWKGAWGGTTWGTGQRIFADNYHPNADKWTTARTLTLSGDASGSVSWDGSANATLSVTVANDSHTHDGRYYTETEADSRFANITGDTFTGHVNVTYNTNTTGSSAPAYGSANIELQTSSNYTPAISFHRGGYSAGVLYEYDGELYSKAWTTRGQDGKLLSTGNIGSHAWTSSNDGSGSGLDADLLDGYHLSTTRNSANTVPVRDGSGYLQLGWINTTSGSTTSTINKIYASYDNYIRYITPATFRSQITDGYYVRGDGTNQSAITIRADNTDFVVADYGDSVTNFIWRDHSANTLYLGTANAVITARSTINANSNNITNVNTITATTLRAGDGTDGRFFSDSAGRTAFADGDFYLQSSVGNFYAYATNTYLGASSGDNIYVRGNTISGNSWSITGAGVATFGTDARAPIFYDNNDTAYYTNPAGTSRLNDLELGRYDTTEQGILYLNGSTTSRQAVLKCTNGNLHIDAHSGYGTYINWYNGSSCVWGVGGSSQVAALNSDYFIHNSDVRSPIFYDSDNTSYYLNPNSTSRLYVIEADGFHAADMGDYFTFYGDNSANHSIGARNESGGASDDLRINSYGAVYINLDSNNNNTSGADFKIGRHGGTGNIANIGMFYVLGDSLYVGTDYSFRAPIFYDSNNTSYYLNPASTTVLNNLTINGTVTGISASATGGGSDNIFWENDQTVTTNYTITNGQNAMSAGPITINSGVTVTVGSGETWTVV